MSVIIRFIDPAELLNQPSERTSPFAILNGEPVRQASIVASEERLWKLAVLTVSPKLAITETVFLLLVLALAIALMIGCLTELYYLLQDDAVSQIAAKAVGATKQIASGL
jgi:hypothetical protein